MDAADRQRSDTAKGFEVLPRRGAVERAFAWLGRCRRLAKDWEKSIASPEAWIDVAHIRLTDASQGTGIVDWIPSQALRFDPGHQMGEGQWSARMRRNSGAKRRKVFS